MPKHPDRKKKSLPAKGQKIETQKKSLHADDSLSSPVCYANSPELRPEFQDDSCCSSLKTHEKAPDADLEEQDKPPLPASP